MYRPDWLRSRTCCNHCVEKNFERSGGDVEIDWLIIHATRFGFGSHVPKVNLRSLIGQLANGDPRQHHVVIVGSEVYRCTGIWLGQHLETSLGFEAIELTAKLENRIAVVEVGRESEGSSLRP